MANTKHKQSIPTGSKLTFTGYAEDDAEGSLTDYVGSVLTITGFDTEDGTYNVELDDDTSVIEALFDDEFEVLDAKEEPAPEAKKTAKKKVAKKKTAAKKAAKTEESPEEQEQEVPTVPAKKTAKKKTAAKKAAPKKVVVKNKADAEEVALPTFKKTTTLASTLKEYNGDAVGAAYDWAEEVEKSNFVLGGLLAFIKRNDSHLSVGSDNVDDEGVAVPTYEKGLKGFNLFVQDYLGLKAVKAHWLVRIYETFSQIATEKQITAVGWTKLRELLPLGDILTKENVGEWLGHADGETTTALHERVDKKLLDSGAKKHGNSGAKNEQTNRKFVFFNSQAEVVDAAIAKKKGEMDEASKGDFPDSAALYAIISEWSDLQGQED